MKAERAHLDFERAGTIMCLLTKKVRQATDFVNGNVSLVNKLHDLQPASPHLSKQSTAQHSTAQHSTAQHAHHHLINLLSLLFFYLDV